MIEGLNRRQMLVGAAAAGTALAIPARLPAQVPAQVPAQIPALPSGLDARATRILEVARREVERAGAPVWHRDLVGVLDFGVHSSIPRFHFANLENGTVRSFLVAHGLGSDPEHDGWLKWFSNDEGSNCTSQGAYITWEWYTGKYGTSIRLGGLDPTNSNTLDRAIVMHPAQYVTEAHVAKWGKCGRSNGCFAMGPDDFREALWHLSGGRLLYADKLWIS